MRLTFLGALAATGALTILLVVVSRSVGPRGSQGERPTAKAVVLAILPFALFLISPVNLHTNAMDAGLAISGKVQYVSETPFSEWLSVGNLPNLLAGLLYWAGLGSDIVSASFSLLGIYCFFIAYFLLLRIFVRSWFFSLFVAACLTLFNPLPHLFTSVFGYQSPWSGNSTYGMLGFSLLTLYLSLVLTRKWLFSAVILILLAWTSPGNAIQAIAVSVCVAASLFFRGSRRDSATLLIGLVPVAILGWSLSRDSQMSTGNSDDFEIYLQLWDFHRSPEMYGIPIATQLLVAGVAIAGMILSKKGFRGKTPESFPSYVFMFVSIAALLPLLVYYFTLVLQAIGLIVYQFQVPFISLMILRTTSYASIPALVILLWLVWAVGSQMASRADEVPTRNKALLATAFTLLVVVGYSILVFEGSGLAPRATWSSRLLLDFSQRDFDNGFEALDEFEEDRMAIAAPGTSLAAMYRFGFPLLVNPDNGIDPVAYMPDTVATTRRIIDDVYGIDFDTPPQRPACGCVPGFESIRTDWEARDASSWLGQSEEFGFRYVVAPATWKLQLPARFSGDDVSVYKIPRLS